MAESVSENELLLDRLADEFAARWRRGEQPTPEDYARLYPALADGIRELFPALAELERAKNAGALTASAEVPAATPVLERVGEFRILRALGKGGMGVVYEAEQVTLGRRVALKVLPQTLLPDARAQQRFEREARAAARLHHTNIVPVFGVGTHEGMPYYVMQYIPGLGLDAVLRELQRWQGSAGPSPDTLPVEPLRAAPRTDAAPSGEPIDAYTLAAPPPPRHEPRPSPPSYWRNIAHIGVQVADALDYAHRQGVLHRDVKPSNLLLDTLGTVWITDFGLAKADDQPNLTHTGDLLGTLRYLPPEAFGGRTDARGDVYALGLTLYEFLALRPAFDETDRARLIKQVVDAAPPRLGKLNPHVPRDLETIVHKTIERDPMHRYGSAGELAADLQRFLADEPIRARRVGPAEQVWRWARHHRAIAAALAVVALLLVVLTVGALFTAAHFRQQEHEQRALAESNDNLAREKGELAAKEAVLRSIAEERGESLRRNLYFARMNQAGQAADTLSGIGQVQDFLADWQDSAPDLRDWEWYYLKGLCHRDLATLHSQYRGVTALAWSPDNRRLATASRGHGIEIWDTVTRQRLRTLHGHTDWLYTIAWSPDGKRLASAGLDKVVKVWNAISGQELHTLRGHGRPIHAVAWAPDSRRLATAGEDGPVWLWDTDTGAQKRLLRGHTNRVVALAWDPPGQRLASGSWDQTLRVWDTARGKELVQLKQASLVDAVAWSPDGARLAAAGWDQVVKLWDTATWSTGRWEWLPSLLDPTPKIILRGHQSRVFALSWEPSGQRLASAAGDGTVKVWDASTGTDLRTLRGHTAEVWAVAWSPDGRRLASGSLDRTIKLWDPEGDPETQTRAGYEGQVRAVSWDATGERLAFATAGAVEYWNVAQAAPPRTLWPHRPMIWALAWAPRGKRLASGGMDGVVRVGDPLRGAALSLHGHNHSIRAIAWSPDGKRLASGGEDGVVQVWDPVEPQPLLTFRGHGTSGVTALAWSPDGTRLASGTWNHSFKVWDAATGKEFFTRVAHENQLTALAFSPDGTRLASASGDRTVKLWDAHDGKELLTLRGHTIWVFAVAWAPDGRRLASASEDGTVKLWDTATGKETLTLRGQAGLIGSVAWSPDGRRLAAGCKEGMVKVWDALPGYIADRSPRLLPFLDAQRPADLRLRTEVFARQGDWERAAADFERCRALGDAAPWLQTGWWVAGPFSDDLRASAPPEANLDPIQADEHTKAERLWRLAHVEARQGLDLGALFDHAEHISAYALTRVYCAAPCAAKVLLGSDDSVRLWLNGRLVHENLTHRPALPDQDVVPITLMAGWNTLLAKVVNGTGEHVLYLRLAADGER
jgi:WD40 repeat protein/serine/threonine protein kinase